MVNRLVCGQQAGILCLQQKRNDGISREQNFTIDSIVRFYNTRRSSRDAEDG